VCRARHVGRGGEIISFENYLRGIGSLISRSRHDCGSPSQHPNFHLHLGHCQVPWTQRISAPQRQQASALTTCESR
jgi:hypothetical protein